MTVNAHGPAPAFPRHPVADSRPRGIALTLMLVAVVVPSVVALISAVAFGSSSGGQIPALLMHLIFFACGIAACLLTGSRVRLRVVGTVLVAGGSLLSTVSSVAAGFAPQLIQGGVPMQAIGLALGLVGAVSSIVILSGWATAVDAGVPWIIGAGAVGLVGSIGVSLIVPLLASTVGNAGLLPILAALPGVAMAVLSAVVVVVAFVAARSRRLAESSSANV